MTSGLAIVLWSADGHQFALEASRVQVLRPYTADLDSRSLHRLIPGLAAEPPRFCMGWQLDQQPYWLAVSDEPRHLHLPADRFWPLPAALQQARQHPAIRALVWHQEHPIILLDATLLD